MTNQKIIFLKGLPGSGKSTWAKEYTSIHYNTIRVNKDDIRMELHNGVFSKTNELLVNEFQMSQVATGLAEGKSVIIDNTHLFGTHEADYRQLANDMDIEFEVKSFLDVPLEVCIERNSKRMPPEVVPDGVIIKMAKSAGLIKKEPLEFDEVIQGFGENAYIFDIDGTLAKMEGRSPYDMGRVSEDSLHIDVAGVLRELAVNNRIIICSGREDTCRKATIEWLEKYEVKYDELFMRKAGDKRNDAIIKYEILVNDIIPKYYVRGVFDDRRRVVDMYRQCGIRVYQVNYGDF